MMTRINVYSCMIMAWENTGAIFGAFGHDRWKRETLKIHHFLMEVPVRGSVRIDVEAMRKAFQSIIGTSA